MSMGLMGRSKLTKEERTCDTSLKTNGTTSLYWTMPKNIYGKVLLKLVAKFDWNRGICLDL